MMQNWIGEVWVRPAEQVHSQVWKDLGQGEGMSSGMERVQEGGMLIGAIGQGRMECPLDRLLRSLNWERRGGKSQEGKF